MLIEAKKPTAGQSGNPMRFIGKRERRGALGWAFLALACGASVSAFAESPRDPEAMAATIPAQELVPKLPEGIAEQDLTSPAGLKNLAVVIVVDETGNYAFYRSKTSTGTPSEEPFSLAGKHIDFFQSFDVYRMNPTCVHTGGATICW